MAVAGGGEVPPLIIPVDLGGGDWLEPVTGAAGMGWSGSCRRGSGEGSLEFGVWSCDSRLMVIWRAAMTWGQMAAVLQLSDLRHHFRRPQRPLQGRLAASLAAAGLFGGKFGHCRAVWRQVSPLQVYLAASFGRCRAVVRLLHSPLF